MGSNRQPKITVASSLQFCIQDLYGSKDFFVETCERKCLTDRKKFAHKNGIACHLSAIRNILQGEKTDEERTISTFFKLHKSFDVETDLLK